MHTLDLAFAAAATLDRVRRERPLVHVIANLVTMLDVANATLAIGARPVMAQAPEEVEEITAGARALVLNLGTPSRERLAAMRLAGLSANAHRIPIVMDPVGVGASAFREQEFQNLRRVRFSILRGNAGEMGALAGITTALSGVDAVHGDYDREAISRALASELECIVVIAGSPDWVSDGKRSWIVGNGSPKLQQITGGGDIQSAIIGAAAAVEPDSHLAATFGLVWLGIAAEQAAANSQSHGLGTFRVALFDALSNLDTETVRRSAKITRL